MRMKRLILFSFILLPFIGVSQSSIKKKGVNWMPLEKAEEYARKYNKDILIFFYKSNCEFCDKMKKNTLNDEEIINTINNNFLPVKLDGYTKDTILFNKKVYGNQQPASSGRKDWRHDFYFEVGNYNNSITTPTIVLFDNNCNKITQFTGFQPKIQLIRNLKKIID